MEKVKYNSNNTGSIVDKLEVLKKDYKSIIEKISSLEMIEFGYSEWLLSLSDIFDECIYNCDHEIEWINSITSKIDSVCDEYIVKIKAINTDFEFKKEYEIK